MWEPSEDRNLSPVFTDHSDVMLYMNSYSCPMREEHHSPSWQMTKPVKHLITDMNHSEFIKVFLRWRHKCSVVCVYVCFWNSHTSVDKMADKYPQRSDTFAYIYGFWTNHRTGSRISIYPNMSRCYLEDYFLQMNHLSIYIKMVLVCVIKTKK